MSLPMWLNDIQRGPVQTTTPAPAQPTHSAYDFSGLTTVQVPSIKDAFDPKYNSFNNALLTSQKTNAVEGLLDAGAQGISPEQMQQASAEEARLRQEAMMQSQQAADLASAQNQNDMLHLGDLRGQIARLMATQEGFPDQVQPRHLSQAEALLLGLATALAPNGRAATDFAGGVYNQLGQNAQKDTAYNVAKWQHETGQRNARIDDLRQELLGTQQGIQHRENTIRDNARYLTSQADALHQRGVEAIKYFHSANTEADVDAAAQIAAKEGVPIPPDVVKAKKAHIRADSTIKLKTYVAMVQSQQITPYGGNLPVDVIAQLQKGVDDYAASMGIPSIPLVNAPTMIAQKEAHDLPGKQARTEKTQAETAKVKADTNLIQIRTEWFPKEAKARIDKNATMAAAAMIRAAKAGASRGGGRGPADPVLAQVKLLGMNRVGLNQALTKDAQSLKEMYKIRTNGSTEIPAGFDYGAFAKENPEFRSALERYQENMQTLNKINQRVQELTGMPTKKNDVDVHRLVRSVFAPWEGATPTKGSPSTPSKKGGTPSRPAPSGKGKAQAGKDFSW